jgi:hypothetical protein
LPGGEEVGAGLQEVGTDVLDDVVDQGGHGVLHRRVRSRTVKVVGGSVR